jgi:hypothetical protein
MAISHAGHTHPSTPAARSACRKAMANGARHEAAEPKGLTMADRIAYVMANPAKAAASSRAKTEAWIASEGTDAARNRIEKARQAECIQAELHTDAHGGCCACGWVANKAA